MNEEKGEEENEKRTVSRNLKANEITKCQRNVQNENIKVDNAPSNYKYMYKFIFYFYILSLARFVCSVSDSGVCISCGGKRR